jgi:hypothetical protein
MYEYDLVKDKKLQTERNISFDELIALIEAGNIIDVLDHPNQTKYPCQKIYIIDVDGYVWLVPYIENDNKIFLKTAFPSRKHTKQYLEEQNVKKRN